MCYVAKDHEAEGHDFVFLDPVPHDLFLHYWTVIAFDTGVVVSFPACVTNEVVLLYFEFVFDC